MARKAKSEPVPEPVAAPAQVEAEIVTAPETLNDLVLETFVLEDLSVRLHVKRLSKFPVEQPKTAAPGESAEDFKRRFDDFWKQPHG